jgi:hypothetical protein
MVSMVKLAGFSLWLISFRFLKKIRYLNDKYPIVRLKAVKRTVVRQADLKTSVGSRVIFLYFTSCQSFSIRIDML